MAALTNTLRVPIQLRAWHMNATFSQYLPYNITGAIESQTRITSKTNYGFCRLAQCRSLELKTTKKQGTNYTAPLFCNQHNFDPRCLTIFLTTKAVERIF